MRLARWADWQMRPLLNIKAKPYWINSHLLPVVSSHTALSVITMNTNLMIPSASVPKGVWSLEETAGLQKGEQGAQPGGLASFLLRCSCLRPAAFRLWAPCPAPGAPCLQLFCLASLLPVYWRCRLPGGPGPLNASRLRCAHRCLLPISLLPCLCKAALSGCATAALHNTCTLPLVTQAACMFKVR